MKDENNIEVLVNKAFMKGIDYNSINSLNLRSDIENNNIYACILKTQGYVGNRPSECTDEFHEDDTWAIDVCTEDGLEVESYLYSSEFEYDQDVELLRPFI